MRSRIVVAAVSVLVLAGCGTPDPLTPPDGPASATPTPSASSPASTPGGVDADQRFGLEDTAQFPDGLEVSTPGAEVRQATTDEKGAEGTGGTIVVVSILITNGTGDAYDPRSAVVSATYGASDTSATMINDASAQLTTGFDSTIAPGDEATTAIGFAIPTTGLGKVTITVDLADGFNDPISFSGKVEKV